VQWVVEFDSVFECGDCGDDGCDVYGDGDGDQWQPDGDGSGYAYGDGELGGTPLPPRCVFRGKVFDSGRLRAKYPQKTDGILGCKPFYSGGLRVKYPPPRINGILGCKVFYSGWLRGKVPRHKMRFMAVKYCLQAG